MKTDARSFIQTLIERDPEIMHQYFIRGQAFYPIGRAALEELDHVVLTAHTPRNQIDRRYRLWTKKPCVDYSDGHPDWTDNKKIALAEMRVGPVVFNGSSLSIREDDIILNILCTEGNGKLRRSVSETYREKHVTKFDLWYCPEVHFYNLK